MGADRQVHERLDQSLRPRLNVIWGNRVCEVKGSRLRGDPQHHARKDPSRWVAQAEVGGEGDQPRLCVQWTEWVEVHVLQRSGDAAFALRNLFTKHGGGGYCGVTPLGPPGCVCSPQ